MQREKYKLKRRLRDPLHWAKQVIAPPMNLQAYASFRSRHKDIKSFLIVRHPFHRLVSAFRDKLERLHSKKAKSDYFYKLYGRDIVKRYRARATERFGEAHFSKENNYGAPVAVPAKKR